jgi:hypothetical protein
MKFLIAGSGSIGRRHIRNLLALGEKDILLYRTHQGTLADEEISQFPFETPIQLQSTWMLLSRQQQLDATG